MTKRKICVVVTARPSYSRIRTALKAIDQHGDLELQLVVAASALLDRYGIQVVVMNAFESNSGSTYVLPLALADPSEKEWKMVFADAGAIVFMRQPPPGVQPLPPERIFASMEAQCQATLNNHHLALLLPRMIPNAIATSPQSYTG